MHGVAPHMCGRGASPLLDRGAGGRSPGFLFIGRTETATARAPSALHHLLLGRCWRMEDAAAREAARGRQRHELRKAPSLVADRAKEIDLQTSDHAAPG